MREVEILKKKQLKCYIYTRVSTSMQVDGYSLDAQRDKLRKYAAYEDMVWLLPGSILTRDFPERISKGGRTSNGC